MPRCPGLIWDGRVLAMVAAWLLTGCVSMHAADSKPDEHAHTPAAHRNVPTANEGKTRTANGADSASCKIRSEDPTTAANTALPAENNDQNNDQERMSKVSNGASSGESLTLQAPSRKEWTEERIHLGAETTLREEPLNDQHEHSRAGSDPKCTPHEAATKNEPAMSN